MPDWKRRAAVEIANAFESVFEAGDVPRAEIEDFVVDAITRHSSAFEDNRPTIEAIGEDRVLETGKVNRVELLDHRRKSRTSGRAFVAWRVSASVSIQDQGRTMKVFVTDPKDDG